MAQQGQYRIEELLERPGTYFNPRTEMMVVVDDSPAIDQEVFDLAELEGAEWVLISDELPIDEDRRDQLLQGFQQAEGTPAEVEEFERAAEGDPESEEPDI